HADFIANFARPGAFSQLESGFVFHFRERTPDGALHGVFMQDQRDPARVTTYIAEDGKTVERDGVTYLQLSKGVLLRPQSAGDSSMVTFDDYTIDLSQFIHAVSTMKRPNERSTAQLMAPDAKDRADPALLGHIRSELLDRLASPLYAFAAGLIAFAALGEARTTRQGRGLAIAGAILAFAGVRMLGFAATTLAVSTPSAAIFVWTRPLAGSRGVRRDRPDAVVLSRRPFRPRGDRRIPGGLRPHLRRRSGGAPAPRRRFAKRDGDHDGGAVVPANPDDRRTGLAVRGSVRVDDRVPEPVAQDGADRRPRGGRVGLAIYHPSARG